MIKSCRNKANPKKFKTGTDGTFNQKAWFFYATATCTNRYTQF
ncbi:MAG: hypothetical protein N4A74_17855 [Carboxylicivirga sp.]|nr:hypothetical protein [Carboxylicivirga sp.]